MQTKMHYLLGLLIILLWACIPPNKEENTTVNQDLSQKGVREALDYQNANLTDSLVTLLSSEDPTLRYMASMSSASLENKMDLADLSPLLDDKVLKVRSAAAYAMGQYKENRVVRYLVNAFKNEDTLSVNTYLNHNILEAIGKSGDETMLNFISSTSTYRDNDTLLLLGQARSLYRFALRGMTSPNGTDKMVKMILSPNVPQDVKLIATNYLARASNLDLSNYQFQLADALSQERNANIKMALALGLKHSQDPDILQVIKDQIESENDYRVKINLMKAIFDHPYGQVVDVMIALLKDKNIHVASTAADYLIQKGRKEDAPYYRQLAEEEGVHWLVKTKLYESVMSNLPPYYVNTIASLRRTVLKEIEETDELNIKRAYIQVLSKDLNAYNSLVNLFENETEPIVKSSIAKSIGQIYSNPAYPLNQNRAGPIARSRIKKELETLVEDGDVGVLYFLANALADEKNNLALLFEDTDFLTQQQSKLKLPRDVETYNALNAAIKACKPDTTVVDYVPSPNLEIDWNFLQKYPDSTLALIKTSQGLIKIELNYKAAPLTVYNFIKLAEANFYDNKTFHRVVPNFVIQGGCPRGDGFGSSDNTIRSEFSQVYYDDGGYIGMASAGPHTESTQWFITHSPTPHLDGRYTIFGKVIEGMDVVHKILPGDEIQDIILTSVL